MGRIVPQRLGGGLRRERPRTASVDRSRKPKEEESTWRDTLRDVNLGLATTAAFASNPVLGYIGGLFRGAPEKPLTPEEKANAEQWKKWMSPGSAGAPSETAQNPPLTPGQQESIDAMERSLQEAAGNLMASSQPPSFPGAVQGQGFGLPEKPDFPGLYKLDEPALSQPNPLSGALINTSGLMRDPEIPRTFLEDRLSPGLESMGVPGHSVARSYRGAIGETRIPGGDKVPLSSFLYGASGPERQHALEAQSAGPNYLPAPVIPTSPGVNQIQQAAQREIAPELSSPQAKTPYGGVTEDELMAFLSGAGGAPQEAPTLPQLGDSGVPSLPSQAPESCMSK